MSSCLGLFFFFVCLLIDLPSLVLLLDGEQEAFLHAEVPPLDTCPPGSHEVTVAEVGEDTKQHLRRQGGD